MPHSSNDRRLAAERVDRLALPEYAEALGSPARTADEAIRDAVSSQVFDTTHFDITRFPPPPWALEAFSAATADGRVAYTPYRGSAGVRADVADALTHFLGVPVDPERELAITPGTQAGLFSVLSALVNPGDEVVVPDPDYPFNERVLRFLDARVTRVRMTATEHGGQLDWEELEQALASRPKLLLLSHPNNPTGAVYDPTTIQRLGEIVSAGDHFVVVDQLYSRLVYEAQYTHLGSVPGLRDRCVTLLGPSKAESMTGFRVGAVVGPPDVIDAVEEVLSVMSLRAPAYSQQVLRHWLVDDGEWMSERVTALQALRDMTVDRLRQLDWLHLDRQGGTAYTFPDVSALGASDVEVATLLASRAQVLVVPGYRFGKQGIGRFRMCYARAEEGWAVVLDRIVSVLDEHFRSHRAV